MRNRRAFRGNRILMLEKAEEQNHFCVCVRVFALTSIMQHTHAPTERERDREGEEEVAKWHINITTFTKTMSFLPITGARMVRVRAALGVGL